MLLLPNIVYQFFFARQHQTQLDPEKGEDVEPAQPGCGGNGTPNTTATGDLEAADNNNNPTANLQASEHAAENLDSIDQNDDNEIIDELEHEEYPDIHQTSRKRHFTALSGVSGSTTSSNPSSWWARTKDILNTHTSPADLEAYVPHYRYLPILSGVIIPFSILLEIPGLTEDWYIRTEGHKVIELRPNTMILNVGLGFSIGFAALANMCLIMRFLEKKIKLMTILCIFFLTIHDTINIIAVITFGIEHRFDDGFTYGQAYWMTVCSTSVSSVTNITLVLDLVRTPDFDVSGSGLTRKQRTLVISVMALLTYIAFGSLVQTFLMDLSFINALYFTIVSIETIGFGDITPNTTGSRVFTCLYSIFGIVNLALTVGLTRETVLEGIEVGYRKRVKLVRARRRKLQFERRVAERWRAAIEWRLRQSGLPIWVPDDRSNKGHRRNIMMTTIHRTKEWWPWYEDRDTRWDWFGTHAGRKFIHAHPRGMHLNVESLSWAQLEAAAMEAGVPLGMLLPEGFRPKDQERSEREEEGGAYRESEGAGNGSSGDGSNEPKRAYSGGENGGAGHVQSSKRTLSPGDMIADPPLPLTHARLGRMIAMLGNFALAVDDESFVTVPKPGERVARKRESLVSPNVNGATDGHPVLQPRSIAEQYEALRVTMEEEERRAFYVRFVIVWVVFLLFWMIGSVIFMATEKWKFGEALYFCFIAFTTIGYGDLTPVTPAGRSVFVFWALLGVATMTILISILSEAYSSRYKSIFRSSLITQTIKRYQQRAHTHPQRLAPPAPLTMVPVRGSESNAEYMDPLPSSILSPTTTVVPSATFPSAPTNDVLSDSRRRVTGQLEALPEKVLEHARTFGEDVQYLIEPQPGERWTDTGRALSVPEGLKRLMDDVAGVERLGERIKDEILRDSDARHALLAISIENALRKIVEVAEEAVGAVRERDKLTELRLTQTDDVVAHTGRETDATVSTLRYREYQHSPNSSVIGE